jgi:hypothetical protein
MYIALVMAKELPAGNEDLGEENGKESLYSNIFRRLMRCHYELNGIKSVTEFSLSLKKTFNEPMIYFQLSKFYEEEGNQKMAEYCKSRYEELSKK